MEVFETKKQQNGNFLRNYIPVIENCHVPIFSGFFDHHSFASFDWNMKNRNEVYPNAADLIRYGSIALFDDNSAEYAELAKEEVPARSCLTGTDSSLPGSPSCRVGAVKAETEAMNACFGNYEAKISQKILTEIAEAGKNRAKRSRREIEGDTTAGEDGSSRVPAGSFKESKKISEAKKQDYIHVRARRGQATDSHSLAERARREKISKKMKYLQDLVPGCNKIAGRAGMLDEIINYVQSLQRQVEFLSMKLATLSPIQQTCVDTFSGHEHPAIKASFPASLFPLATLPHLQLSATHQQVPSSESQTPINALEIAANSPLLIPETYPDLSPSYSRLTSFWDCSKQSINEKPMIVPVSHQHYSADNPSISRYG